MKKKIVPSNASKKTATTNPKSRSEKDLDDLVHSDKEELPVEKNEEDPDDRVHRLNRSKSNQINNPGNMEDPDDLVHDYREENEE